jgi:hypothetical protein
MLKQLLTHWVVYTYNTAQLILFHRLLLALASGVNAVVSPLALLHQLF